MNTVGQTTTIFQINEACELSQDSYYTRNPEDANISMAIGPDSPESIFVESVSLTKFEDSEDGQVWYNATVKHDGIWEIYTDTAVGPFVALKLQEAGINTTYCDFSEQGMQDNGLADLDIEVA
jgi:hypothetical protein|tara:strand:- start:282 stop:650 length:369 start_codon:yes stop_codon:yes gene_type:complete